MGAVIKGDTLRADIRLQKEGYLRCRIMRSVVGTVSGMKICSAIRADGWSKIPTERAGHGKEM